MIAEYNLVTESDNTKHSGLTGADNGNKRILLRDQVGLSGFCFLWIVYV